MLHGWVIFEFQPLLSDGGSIRKVLVVTQASLHFHINGQRWWRVDDLSIRLYVWWFYSNLSFADNNSHSPTCGPCKSVESHSNLLPDCRFSAAVSLRHGSLHLCIVKNELLDPLQMFCGSAAVSQSRGWFYQSARKGPGSTFLNLILISICKFPRNDGDFRLKIDERWKETKLDVNFKVH